MKIESRFHLGILAAVVAATSCATMTPTQEDAAIRERVSNVTAVVGYREFDEDDWEPVDSQTAFALEFDTRSTTAPVGWEVGASYSSDDDTLNDPFLGRLRAEAEFLELYGGVRKTWGAADRRFHPYVGGGLTYVEADVEVEVAGLGRASEDDGSIGGYVHGGVSFDLTRALLIGFDVRAVLGTDIEIAGVSADADYVQAAVLLGVSF